MLKSRLEPEPSSARVIRDRERTPEPEPSAAPGHAAAAAAAGEDGAEGSQEDRAEDRQEAAASALRWVEPSRRAHVQRNVAQATYLLGHWRAERRLEQQAHEAGGVLRGAMRVRSCLQQWERMAGEMGAEVVPYGVS